MTMIEKMARAICRIAVERGLKADWSAPTGGHSEATIRQFVDRDWNKHIDAARAALTAMLEPGEAMVKAGKPWAGVSGNSSRKTIVAAIQAALDEKQS